MLEYSTRLRAASGRAFGVDESSGYRSGRVRESGELQVEQLRAAALRLVEMAAHARWRGPDPYDGLFARWPAPLVGGRRRRQTIIQLHARSPVDIRRLYRRHHSLVPKAPALLGQAAVRLSAEEGDDAHVRNLARDAMETLIADTTSGEHAWGYPWDTQTRWSFYRGGSPNIVATAFSANALAEAAATLDEPAWRQRAERAAGWVARELYLSDQGYFAYHGRSDRLVHNANLLGAALVHELAPQSPGRQTRCASPPRGHWMHNRPTAPGPTGRVRPRMGRRLSHRVRLGLAMPAGGSGSPDPFSHRAGGARLFVGFLRHRWPPEAVARQRYPEDSHSAGTGLTVLTRLVARDSIPAEAVQRLAQYTLTHLLHRDGHAVFRRQRWATNGMFATCGGVMRP